VNRTALLSLLLSLALPAAPLAPLRAARAEGGWEPSKPVELLVAAGPGGASDQMARLVQSAIAKHQLMRQPLVVQLRGGASGGEALIEAKASPGDPHKLLLAISNIYTLPLGSGLPFHWSEVTPVAMLALDPFVLWVNAAKPYQTPQQYLDAVKAAPPQSFKMGGTGSRREDQIVTSAIEQKAGVRFAYVPYKSGGEVSTQLVGEHIDSCVNNPSESAAQWRAGQLRPLCVLGAERMSQREPVAGERSWADIATCGELGLDAQYTMLRGFLLPAGVQPEQRAFYTELLRKVSETPEWKEYAARNALIDRFVSGAEFEQFLGEDEQRHKTLMEAAGLLKP
jgi:putative tricarboxylic transport membrane protein